jgi:penicillin-binding protein 1A
MVLQRLISALFALVLVFAAVSGGAVFFGLWYYGRDLPDYQQLADYQPPITTRLHANDGKLIAEFARERRLFVPIAAMPKIVIDAFLSAEDKSFYSHPGVDFIGVVRAMAQNLANIGQNKRLVGASTITQQVAKNLLLSGEVSVERKLREILLAFRIDRAFSKERILELYLNQIYLGGGAYGVAAAALQYFDKPLDELTLAEAAYLAALPKAPNNYHPTRFPDRAKARRDWVIERMREDGVIGEEAAEVARASPLIAQLRPESPFVQAEWFAEEVRRQLLQRYGEAELYEGGLSVRTTMDSRLQAIGEAALRAGLVEFSRRHGFKGPLAKIGTEVGWRERLDPVLQSARLVGNWTVAVVLATNDAGAEIGLVDGSRGHIPVGEVQWADTRAQKPGRQVFRPRDILSAGDVVAVEALPEGKGKFALRQIPEVDGALVAFDPHTGRVLALVGGWEFKHSQFNRATQAERQPGSAFKPFVYAAALDHGFTPASLVLDAPFAIDQGAGLGIWKPANYGDTFLGPTTLRVGLEKSRNLVTVRLAQAVGMETVVEYARRFGIAERMEPVLAMSLGAGETTLLRLTAAYAQFVNGGRRIEPSLIDRVQDRYGHSVFRHDQRPCPDCIASSWSNQPPPVLPDTREQILGPATAYQIVAMLQGVIERGTGQRIRDLGLTLAGKTGTTNDSTDAWFIGFSPDLAVGVYVGYDTPRSLGDQETGASVAVPIFREFMARALGQSPRVPFRVPEGVRLVTVRADTGRPTLPGDPQAILEPFKPGTEPMGLQTVLDGSPLPPEGVPATPAGETLTPGPEAGGTGGLY